MPTSAPIEITPVVTTVSKVPIIADDMPTVTVQAKFDWKFWAGIAAAVVAGYVLLSSIGHTARDSDAKRVRRRRWN